MTRREKLLAQRRTLLITECALQRITLTMQTEALGSATDWLKTSNLVGRLKNLPGWVSATLLGLVIIAPGRVISLAKNGLLLWQIWRSVSFRSER